MLEFLENFDKKVNETYIQLYTLQAQFVVVLLNAHTKFCDNLLKLTLVQVFIMTCAFTCRFMNETEILTSVCWLLKSCFEPTLSMSRYLLVLNK